MAFKTSYLFYAFSLWYLTQLTFPWAGSTVFRPLWVEPGLPKMADSLDAQTGLIMAPGLVLVKKNCLRCHSPQLISAKRATREGWTTTIRWMQHTQGLGDLGPAESAILDYLARHYAPTKEGRRPPLRDIKWYRLE